jgi:hypothetical protein
MEVLFVNLRAYKVQLLRMEVPQVAAFSIVVDLLKAMSLTPHVCYELKSLDYEAIIIEFANCLLIKFNGDILFKFPHVHHPLGQSKQLQSMDRKFNGHVWCKLQINNIKNSFGLSFIMTKCLGNLRCQNDSYPLFQHFFVCNEVFWSEDSLQLLISRYCFMKSPICTISYKFCNSSLTYLQTYSSRMYYVVHKFPNLSRITIHLGTHAHPIIDGKCK